MTGRPRACFEPTIRSSSPPTRSLAPSANRAGSSLGSSTKNEPSSPCGRPTRPMTTRSSTRQALEIRRRLLPAGKRRLGARDVCPPELDPRAEERPVRAWPVLVRHADAAGVDQADSVDLPLELNVRVAGDDDRGVDAREHLAQPVDRRRGRDDLPVVARGGVAEEDRAEVLDLKQVALR